MKAWLATAVGRRVAAVVGGAAVALFVLAVTGTLPDGIQDGLANAVDNVGVDLPGGDNQLGATGEDDDDGSVSFPDLQLEPSPSVRPTPAPSMTPRPYRGSSRSRSSYYDPYAYEDDDGGSYYNPYDPYAEEDDDDVYIPPPDDDGDDDSSAGYGQPGEGGQPGVPNGSNDNAGTPGEGGPGGAPGL